MQSAAWNYFEIRCIMLIFQSTAFLNTGFILGNKALVLAMVMQWDVQSKEIFLPRQVRVSSTLSITFSLI